MKGFYGYIYTTALLLTIYSLKFLNSTTTNKMNINYLYTPEKLSIFLSPLAMLQIEVICLVKKGCKKGKTLEGRN